MFWFFGHPEVYIIILPAMGMISEIIPVFARKPIFGYKAVAYSTVGIAFFSLLVWAHHMSETSKEHEPIDVVAEEVHPVDGVRVAVVDATHDFDARRCHSPTMPHAARAGSPRHTNVTNL